MGTNPIFEPTYTQISAMERNFELEFRPDFSHRHVAFVAFLFAALLFAHYHSYNYVHIGCYLILFFFNSALLAYLNSIIFLYMPYKFLDLNDRNKNIKRLIFVHFGSQTTLE